MCISHHPDHNYTVKLQTYFPLCFQPSCKTFLPVHLCWAGSFSPHYRLILVITLPLQAIIHPDTGDKILMPFRMSGTVAWSAAAAAAACYVVQHGGGAHPGTCHWVLQVVGKRSHSAGRWLKPRSHRDGDVLQASERAAPARASSFKAPF